MHESSYTTLTKKFNLGGMHCAMHESRGYFSSRRLCNATLFQLMNGRVAEITRYNHMFCWHGEWYLYRIPSFVKPNFVQFVVCMLHRSYMYCNDIWTYCMQAIFFSYRHDAQFMFRYCPVCMCIWLVICNALVSLANHSLLNPIMNPLYRDDYHNNDKIVWVI